MSKIGTVVREDVINKVSCEEAQRMKRAELIVDSEVFAVDARGVEEGGDLVKTRNWSETHLARSAARRGQPRRR